MTQQEYDELKINYRKALSAINMYRLTLKWVAEDLEAGAMDPKTIAAAKSDLASHLNAQIVADMAGIEQGDEDATRAHE